MNNQTRTQIVDKHGNPVIGSVIPDGGRMRVTMLLMDSRKPPAAVHTVIKDMAGHRPGSLPLTDADRTRRVTMYRTRDVALSARWKAAAPSPLETVQLEQVRRAAPPASDLTAAYGERDKKLSERWKGKGGAA